MAFTADHKRALSTARLKVYDREEYDSIRNLARAYLELAQKKLVAVENPDDALARLFGEMGVKFVDATPKDTSTCAACKGDPYECAANPGRHCEAK